MYEEIKIIKSAGAIKKIRLASVKITCTCQGISANATAAISEVLLENSKDLQAVNVNNDTNAKDAINVKFTAAIGSLKIKKNLKTPSYSQLASS